MKQKSSITAKLPCQLNQPIFLDLSEAYKIRLIQESASYILKLYIYSSKHLIQTVFSNKCSTVSTHFLEKTYPMHARVLYQVPRMRVFTSPLFHVFIPQVNVCTAIPVIEVKFIPLSLFLIIVYPQPCYLNSVNKYISSCKNISIHLFRLLIKDLHFFFQL